MEINKREEIIELYDIYGLLLTDKQRMYFEEYYFMDLSLQEIADNYEISKNGVFDQIKRTIHTLELYEEKLMLRKKIEKINSLNIADNIKEEILMIIKE
ncbi:MAG: hypothetical protein MR357_08740 [Anaeroplasma sp.]|nr:hypothetical protein [Anaeroplasma sp.]